MESMDVARDAAERGDWPKAEQALLDVQERSARLLRELGLQDGSAKPPDEPRSQGGVMLGGTQVTIELMILEPSLC